MFIGGNARKNCHYCMWMNEDAFPSMEPNPYPVNHCLPKDFDANKIPRATCPFGCLTVAIYDYIRKSSGDLLRYYCLFMHNGIQSFPSQSTTDNHRLSLPEYANLPRGYLEFWNETSLVDSDAERTAVLTSFFRGCAPFPISEHKCKVRIFSQF